MKGTKRDYFAIFSTILKLSGFCLSFVRMADMTAVVFRSYLP